ncbi:Protein of unknown function [Gryllus bimaculatus]|nr:Protein of unknown function [Gryllus bimaculatus]
MKFADHLDLSLISRTLECPNMGLCAELLYAAAVFLLLWQACTAEIYDGFHFSYDGFADGGKSDKEILDELLKSSRYDKRLPGAACEVTAPATHPTPPPSLPACRRGR